MGKKANNKSKKLPLKKKIPPRPLSIRVDMPRIVARQDETYRPVRLTNEAINLGYEKLKEKATTPKLRTKISNAQENFNVRQGRHLLVVTRGYDTTRREKQQQKSEDAERGKQQRIREQFSSETPYSVINNIESARRNQPLLWNKDIVDNAKNMLNIVNRDYLVIPGYLSMISAYNPYTQNLEIAQTFSDATRLHGYVNAAQMATAAGLAPLKFGLSLGAIYAGNKLGDKAVDLGMKWFTPYNSWYDYANKKWGYNEEEALRSNPGGWILGGLGMFLGPKAANAKPFIPLRLSYELSDPAYLLDVGYVTTSEQNPSMFNRFRLGDLEINNPNLYYRQGGPEMGESFLRTGTITPGPYYKNPMFSKGKPFYGSGELAISRGTNSSKPTNLKGKTFILLKDKDKTVKTDVITSSAPMAPANTSSVPIKPIITDNYATRANDPSGRYIPAGETNTSNTTLYRYDPSYGYRKIIPDNEPLIMPFDKPLVDQDGNLLMSVDEILALVKERIPFGKNPEEIINKGFGGKTNLKEHIEAVVKSAQEYPLPEGVSRLDFVASALYHDLGKVLNPTSSHGGTSNYIVDLMGWPTNKAILGAVNNHMLPLSFFSSDSNLAQGLHAADVGRGRSFHDLLELYSHLEYPTKTTGEPTLTKHLLGDEAIRMFKEYGGEPLPENSKIGELLRKYVPEARERYGIVNRPEITDEEIAQALYKLIISLDNLTMNPYYSTEEPLLGFRGDTLRYTELKPRPTPDELVKSGGTMDNSLGSLFLGELPEAERGVGVDRYVVTLNPESSETSGLWQVNTEPSATGAGSVNIPKTISYTGEGYPPLFSEYSSYTLTPHFINDRGYFWAPKIKVKPQYTTSGVNDINGFMFKGKPRDASFEIEVGESGRAAEQKYGFKLHTAEKPVANPDDPEGVTLIWNGKELNLVDDAGVEHGAARELMAEHYTNLLNDALQNNQGVLLSASRSVSSGSAHPFRGEHGHYTYIALPNYNIKGAKHILPYDLRLPRNWNDPNIYKGAAVRKNRYIWNYDPKDPHHISLDDSSVTNAYLNTRDVVNPKSINNGLTPEAEAELAKRANWLGDSLQLMKDRLNSGGKERLAKTALEVYSLFPEKIHYVYNEDGTISADPPLTLGYYSSFNFLKGKVNDNISTTFKPSARLGALGENIGHGSKNDGLVLFTDRPYEYLFRLPTSDVEGHEFYHWLTEPFEPLSSDVYDVSLIDDPEILEYFLFRNNEEIAARIALLKNYYGLKENEPITGDHFRYAEKHFVLDRGYDNNMTDFFKGIVDYDKLAEWANRNVLGIAVPLGIGLGISSLE